MPNWATAENENGQLYETACEAVRAVAKRFREGRLECEECELPILSMRLPSSKGFVIAVYPERNGWNVDVLHTLCDQPAATPAIADICDGQAVEGD